METLTKKACFRHNPTLPCNRTAQQPVPLLSSCEFAKYRHGHYRFIRSLQRQVVRHSDNDITITPPDRQISSWTSDPEGIPIGATGMWYTFGNVPEVWKMAGLTGCTVISIVYRRGFWAGHLWESTKPAKINGGSAFLERRSANEVVERPDCVFQKVAVDILTQQTPEDQVANRDFTSLADLKARFGDPFHNGSEVDVFVMTKARSATDPRQKYASKVALLRAGIEAAIPGCNYRDLTYIGDPALINVPADVNGVISIQYTPYSHAVVGTCGKKTQYAAVKVWAELHGQPVVEKQWKPLARQRMAMHGVSPWGYFLQYQFQRKLHRLRQRGDLARTLRSRPPQREQKKTKTRKGQEVVSDTAP